MAMGDGKHMLPVKAEIREAIVKDVGDTVTVTLEERIGSAKLRPKRTASSSTGENPHPLKNHHEECATRPTLS